MIGRHDYISFYEKEIGIRKSFNYPPFSRMCLIEVSGKESTRVTTIASKIFLFLRRHNNSKSIEIMKPAPALIYKLKNQYRYHIIIKSLKPEISGTEQNVIATETLLKNLERYISDSKLKHSERISIEVDPLDFM
jgi:primosomal protein N' (replication factor Y)